MKGTAFSGILPFAEFEDGQISQGVCRWTEPAGGQIIGADRSEKLQPCYLGLFRQRANQKNCSPAVCLSRQRAAVSAFFYFIHERILLKNAFEVCFYHPRGW
jgi:hypothetical protein